MQRDEFEPKLRRREADPRLLKDINLWLNGLGFEFMPESLDAEAFFRENAEAVIGPLLRLRTDYPLSIRRKSSLLRAISTAIGAGGIGTERSYSTSEHATLSILLLDTATLDSPHYDHETAIAILRELQRLQSLADYDLVARFARNPDLFRVHPLISRVASEVIATLEFARARRSTSETLLRPATVPANSNTLVRPAPSSDSHGVSLLRRVHAVEEQVDK